MRILITNDDGYQAKGIKVLAEIMGRFGEVTVVGPKVHQSGMSSAVSIGFKAIAHKELGNGWHYVDATPASCIKYGLNTIFRGNHPDLVVSGINLGSNTSVAACYSGTLGATEEAAINGIPAIGVSIDNHHVDADLSAVEKYLPSIIEKLMEDYPQKYGVYYNINFPNLPAGEIKGVRVASQGRGRWVREFKEWDAEHWAEFGITPEMLGQKANPEVEEGEDLFMMVGEFEDDGKSRPDSDHLYVNEGYISVVPHNVDCTDYQDIERLKSAGLEAEF